MFREILANYDFDLEYTKGEDMPSDFFSRHVKVESAAVKVDPNLCGKKSFRIDSKALCSYITKETKTECVEKSEF